MMVPGEGSMLPIRETPERSGVVGNVVWRGFSMFKPFWIRTMVVWVFSGESTGLRRSATVGGMSGMFLVVRTM